jgi:hypothetical protein
MCVREVGAMDFGKIISLLMKNDPKSKNLQGK